MDLRPLLPAKGPLAEARVETFANLAMEETETADQRAQILEMDTGELAKRAHRRLRRQAAEDEVVQVGDPDSRLAEYYIGTVAIYLQIVALAREADKNTREALADRARTLREHATDNKLASTWIRAVNDADTAAEMLAILEAADPEARPQF